MRRLVVGLALLWAGLTAVRVSVWASDLTLWTDAAQRSTRVRPHLNRRAALLEAGDWPEALAECDRVLHQSTAVTPLDRRWAVSQCFTR